MEVRIPASLKCTAATEWLDCRKCKRHNKALWDNPNVEPNVPCTGRLIYLNITRETPFWPEYDILRTRWCRDHRGAWTPLGFREGKLHWWNILFMKYQEVKNGSSK